MIKLPNGKEFKTQEAAEAYLQALKDANTQQCESLEVMIKNVENALKPDTPKGCGVVDWDKNVYGIIKRGPHQCVELLETQYQHEHTIEISNNKQYIERLVKQRAIIHQLRCCDGAVDEPVKGDDNRYWYAERGGEVSGHTEIDYVKNTALVCFASSDYAVEAVEKVGAENIKQVWGIE